MALLLSVVPDQMPVKLGKLLLTEGKIILESPNFTGHNLTAPRQQSQRHSLTVQIEKLPTVRHDSPSPPPAFG